MKKLAISVISIGLISVFGGTASGAIFRVPSEYPTIQAGIDAASDGDTVLVADGVYVGEGNRDLVFGGKIITLQSENGPVNSIIDCQGFGRALSSNPNTSAKDVVIRGFTIKNGVSLRGGAIYWGYTSANLTVENCIFLDNYNSAIWTIGLKDDSIVTISDCDFIGNEGAVLRTDGGGALTLAKGGNAVITDCGFYGNTSGPRAGAIRISGDTTTDIKNCIFMDNISNHDAGAISFEYGKNRLANCIFAGNRAGGRGGAIYTSGISTPSFLTIINSTLTGNKAYTGGAIWLSFDSFPIITNSILWENTPNEIDGGGGVPTVTYSDIQGDYIGEGNIDDAPLFMDITDPDAINWNLRLQRDSPCIDAGDDLAPDLPSTDLDSKPRRIDGDGDLTVVVDMGAYECGDICECDYPVDLDTDGADLAEYINDNRGQDLSILAGDYGRNNCPKYEFTP